MPIFVWAYKHDVVVVIKMGAYIRGVLILCGCLLSQFYICIGVLRACPLNEVLCTSMLLPHYLIASLQTNEGPQNSSSSTIPLCVYLTLHHMSHM